MLYRDPAARLAASHLFPLCKMPWLPLSVELREAAVEETSLTHREAPKPS